MSRVQRRFDLLGVEVSAFDLSAAVEEIGSAIAAGLQTYVSTCPAYTVMQGHDRPEVAAALNAANWATPDGVPVVWALRLLGARQIGRVYGPDLMLALTELSARKGYRQFYLGGAPGVAETLAQTLTRRLPGLQVAGTYCPAFEESTPQDEEEMIERVNASGANIVWVGLGSPKQDLWMAKYRPRLKPELLIGVGAAFDFLTGRVPQAPRWMQEHGLEWVFRLAHEPRRLWRRYLVYNPRFAVAVALQLIELKRRGVRAPRD